MARDTWKQLDSAQNFQANAPVSFDLPRDQVYKEILLRLESQFSASTSAATPFEGAPWGLIKRIELIADGKDTIKSYDGFTLHDINYFDYGVFGAIEDIDIGATNTGLYNNGLIIALEAPNMIFPQHTWLDSRKLSSLELRITFGSGIADIYTTQTGGAVDTYRLTPFGHEILDIDPASAFSMNQEVMTSQSFPTNTATQRKFKLNVGNAYRRILISSRDSNARAIVDRLTKIALIENGIFYRRSLPAAVVKLINALKFHPTGIGSGGENPVIPTVAAGGPTTGQVASYRNGVYNLNIAEDGSESALLDTRGYSDLSLELDWDGANNTDLLRFTPSIYIPNVR